LSHCASAKGLTSAIVPAIYIDLMRPQVGDARREHGCVFVLALRA